MPQSQLNSLHFLWAALGCEEARFMRGELRPDMDQLLKNTSPEQLTLITIYVIV